MPKNIFMNNKTSLKKLTVNYSFFIFCIVIILSSVSFWQTNNYLQQKRIDIQLNNVLIKAKDVSSIFNFYRDIVKQIATQDQVNKLVQFGNKEEGHTWATKMQKLLPQNIGLALFDENGYILGDPPNLKIGKYCLKDLNLHFSNIPIAKPPVHTAVEKYAHFDIIENVVENDEVLGVVFASFSLGIIQTKLDDIIENGQKLSIVTPDDVLIASANQLNSNHILLNKKINIPETDLFLLIEIEKENINNLFYVQFFSNFALFIIVFFCIYLFSQHINTIMKKDFNIITSLLNSLKTTQKLPDNHFDTHLVETENLLSGVISIAEEIAFYQKKLLDESNTDELTQLANRRYFKEYAEQCLAQAERKGDKVALLYMDLDGFKAVNDNIGHYAGDIVLTTMADRFRTFLRKDEFISRLGGDEFCMLVYGYNETVELENMAKRLMNKCTKAITIDGIEVKIGISIGIATYPENGKTYNEIMSIADNAMYKNKRNNNALSK